MEKKFDFSSAIDQLIVAVEERKRPRWHQVISGAGERANLNQQFTSNGARVTVGYLEPFSFRDGRFLVGRNENFDKIFTIKYSEDEEEYIGNCQAALDEALNFIKYHL